MKQLDSNSLIELHLPSQARTHDASPRFPRWLTHPLLFTKKKPMLPRWARSSLVFCAWFRFFCRLSPLLSNEGARKEGRIEPRKPQRGFNQRGTDENEKDVSIEETVLHWGQHKKCKAMQGRRCKLFVLLFSFWKHAVQARRL
jgi:hypothetical protein